MNNIIVNGAAISTERTGLYVDCGSTPFTVSNTDTVPNIISWPMTIEKATDVMFSHNEIIALWYQSSSEGSVRIWRGEAWALPDEYKDLSISKVFGVIPDEIWQGDQINLMVDTDDSTPRNLPKKHHDLNQCEGR